MTELHHATKDRIEGSTIILHDDQTSDKSTLKYLKIFTEDGEKNYRIIKTKKGRFLMN